MVSSRNSLNCSLPFLLLTLLHFFSSDSFLSTALLTASALTLSFLLTKRGNPHSPTPSPPDHRHHPSGAEQQYYSGRRSLDPKGETFEATHSREAAQESNSCSEGSIPDEEGLIEIALADGQVVQQSNVWSQELQEEEEEDEVLLLRKDGLVEALAEIGEEENLIEIDVAVGSIIKCSRCGIKA